MLRSILVGLTVLAFMFGSAVSAAIAEEEIPFKICYEDVPQPPYYYGTGPAVPEIMPGIYLDLSALLEKRLDVKISHIRAPWKRCLALMENNDVDAVYGASFKPSRLGMGRYPMKNGKPDIERRIATKSYSLYKNKSAAIAWDGEEFKNTEEVVGAPLGYSIVSFMEERGVTVKTRWNTTAGLKLVSMGRLAAFATQDPAGDALLRENPYNLSNVIKVSPPLQTKSYYMMISHKFYEENSKLSEGLWGEIGEIRKLEIPKLYIKYLN